MSDSHPLPAQSTLAERIAWMHEPVHLRCAFVPWFVLRMLEAALHSYLCSFEKAYLELMELHRQGKLEPWPDAQEGRQRRRAPRYRMKFAPSVDSSGAAHDVACAADADVGAVQRAHDAKALAAEAAVDPSEAATAEWADASVSASAAALVGIGVAQRQTLGLPLSAIDRQRRTQRRFAERRAAVRDCCHRLTVCKPGWAVRENCVQFVTIIQR